MDGGGNVKWLRRLITMLDTRSVVNVHTPSTRAAEQKLLNEHNLESSSPSERHALPLQRFQDNEISSSFNSNLIQLLQLN